MSHLLRATFTLHDLQFKNHSQENIGLVIPWMVGILTFMSLEAVSTVYLNILRDHINGVRKYFSTSISAMFALIKKIFLSTPFSILMACAKQKLWVHKFLFSLFLMKSEVEIPIGANGLRKHYFISFNGNLFLPFSSAVLPRSSIFQRKFFLNFRHSTLKPLVFLKMQFTLITDGSDVRRDEILPHGSVGDLLQSQRDIHRALTKLSARVRR